MQGPSDNGILWVWGSSGMWGGIREQSLVGATWVRGPLRGSSERGARRMLYVSVCIGKTAVVDWGDLWFSWVRQVGASVRYGWVCFFKSTNMSLGPLVPEGFRSLLKRFSLCCKLVFVWQLPGLHNAVLRRGQVILAGSSGLCPSRSASLTVRPFPRAEAPAAGSPRKGILFFASFDWNRSILNGHLLLRLEKLHSLVVYLRSEVRSPPLGSA